MVHSGGDYPKFMQNVPPTKNKIAEAFDFPNDSNANLPVLRPINLKKDDPQQWQPPNNLGSSASVPSTNYLEGNPKNNAFVKALQPHARPLNPNAAIPPGFIPEGIFNPKKRLVRQEGQRNLIFGNAMANLRQKQAMEAAKPAWKRMLGFGGKSRSRRHRHRHRKTRKNRRS